MKYLLFLFLCCTLTLSAQDPTLYNKNTCIFINGAPSSGTAMMTVFGDVYQSSNAADSDNQIGGEPGTVLNISGDITIEEGGADFLKDGNKMAVRLMGGEQLLRRILPPLTSSSALGTFNFFNLLVAGTGDKRLESRIDLANDLTWESAVNVLGNNPGTIRLDDQNLVGEPEDPTLVNEAIDRRFKDAPSVNSNIATFNEIPVKANFLNDQEQLFGAGFWLKQNGVTALYFARSEGSENLVPGVLRSEENRYFMSTNSNEPADIAISYELIPNTGFDPADLTIWARRFSGGGSVNLGADEVSNGRIILNNVDGTLLDGGVAFSYAPCPKPLVDLDVPAQQILCQNRPNTLAVANPNNLTLTYEWSTGETTSSIEVIPETLADLTYSVTVTDVSKCFRTFEVPLTVLPTPGVAINLGSASDTVSVCQGSTLEIRPTITNTGTNGESVEYSWNTGETTPDIDYTGDGSGRMDTLILSVRVTNFAGSAAGCAQSDTIYLRNERIEGFDLGEPTRVFCDGTTSTTLTTGITDVTGLAIDWSGPNGFSSNANTITVNETGTYSVTVNDGTCTIGGSVDVFFSNPAGNLSIVGPACHPNNQPLGADNSISLLVEMTSGISSFQYFVPELGLNGDIEGPDFVIMPIAPEPLFLPDTDYTVEIIDGVGCPVLLGPVRYLTPAELAVADPAIVDDFCGEATGSISLTPSGGTAPYAYNWSNGENGLNLAAIENLPQNEYSATITDANGCELPVTDLVVNGASSGTPLRLFFSNTRTNCPGEPAMITIFGNGGNPGYTYSSDGVNFDGTTEYLLFPATYTFFVRDTEGCVAEEQITVEDGIGPGPLVANITQEIRCAGETASVEILPFSQVEYSLDGINFDFFNEFSGLSGGNYRAYARNFVGCLDSVDFVIVEPGALAVNVAGTVVQEDVCGLGEGFINLVVTGGTGELIYNWDTPAGDMSCCPQNLTAGTYNITVSDENQCSLETSFVVGGAAGAMMVGNSMATNASCNGSTDGSIFFSFDGGTSPYRYSLNGGAEIPLAGTELNLTDQGAGDYNFVVLDANGCSFTSSFTLTEPEPILITFESSTPSGCGASGTGAIDLTVTGPQDIFIVWSDNGPPTADRDNLAAGDYTVTVGLLSNPACFQELTITVGQLQPPVLGILSTDDDCLDGGGSITASASGGQPPYSFAWADGATGPNRSGLVPDDYTVTVTDANQCADSETITISGPALALSVSGVETNVSCSGFNDGAIDLTVAGGTGPYTFDWSNGAVAEDLTELAPGDYDVTVADVNGCTQLASFAVSEPVALSATATVTNVVITGERDGAIDLMVSGGTLPYNYVWTSNGAQISSDQDLAGLPAGTYEVMISDGNGCTLQRTFLVTEPSSIILEFTETPITCNGAADGSLMVTASGGPGGGYSFRWTLNGALVGTTQTITDLGPGDYIVEVTHPSGNNASGSYNLAEPTALSVIPIITRPSCAGAADGAIRLNVSGGTGTYSFNWSGGLAGVNPQNLLAGDYEVTVTDERGCIFQASYTVADRAPIVILAESVTPAGCGVGGSIDLTVTGPDDILISWADGPETTDRNNLVAGDYTITVRRAGNGACFETLTFTIGQLEAPVLSSALTNDDCLADAGSISLTVSGGAAPFTFAWSDGSAGPDRFGLSAGAYSVTVTDANNCTDEQNVSVTAPAAALTLPATETNVSCNGAADGSIVLEASGGTAPYRYSWSNGSSGNSLEALSPGDYDVTILDANDCTISGSYTISEPEVLAISAVVTDLVLTGGSDGAIDVTVSGGTMPYTFAWEEAGTPLTNTEDLDGLTASTYQLVVTDARGCSLNRTYIVNEPSAITLEIGEIPISCNGALDGSLSVTATGGVGAYIINWRTGGILIGVGETIGNLGAGTYTVTVIDENGNENSLAYELLEPTALSVLPQLTNPGCAGEASGSILLTTSGGSGGYSYAWSDGGAGNPRTDLAAGSYEVTITDAAGCVLVPAPLTLTAPASLALNGIVTPLTGTGASNGAIDLTVTGGTLPYVFNWSNGAQTEDLTGLTDGQYSVTVTDRNDCTATASFTIDARELLVVNADLTDVSCNGGSDGAIMLTVSGGDGAYVYTWEDGSQAATRSGLVAGMYSVTITNPQTPDFTASYTIREPEAIAYTIDVTEVSCFGATDGAISWQSGTVTGVLADLGTGDYEVTITNDDGCSTVVSIVVPEPAALQLTASVTNVSATMAADGGIDLTVTGGTPFATGTSYRYSWSPGGQIVQDLAGLSGGDYTVTVTDANGCTASQTITVSEPGVIVVTAVVTDVRCNGETNGAINLTASGGFGFLNYAWEDGPTSEDRSNLAAGNYTVSVSDINGQVVMETFTVGEPDLIAANAVLASPGCVGDLDGTITLSPSGGTGGFTYRWEDGSDADNRSGLPAGSYAVTITDDNGCRLLDSYDLTDPTPVTISLSLTAPGCGTTGTGTIDLTAGGGTPGYTFRWGGGQITEDLNSISAGAYSVTVTDANGCTADSTFNLLPAGDITQLVAEATDVSCSGGNDGSVVLAIELADQAYTYAWSNGAVTASLPAVTAGNYRVTVTSSTGCTATTSAVVAAPQALVANTQANAAGCRPGEGGAANVVVSGGTPEYTYAWSNGATGDVVLDLPAGAATVTVTDANGCTATAAADIMEAEDDFEVKFLAATPVDALEDIQFVDVSFPRPQSWFYDFADPGGNFSEEPNPIFAYPFDDLFRTIVYPVTLTATSLFCEDFVVKDITVVSLNRRDGQAGTPGGPATPAPVYANIEQVDLYPNPTPDYAEVHIELNREADVELSLVDANGRILQTKKLAGGDGYDWVINLNGLPAGAYFVRVTTAFGMSTKVLILQ